MRVATPISAHLKFGRIVPKLHGAYHDVVAQNPRTAKRIIMTLGSVVWYGLTGRARLKERQKRAQVIGVQMDFETCVRFHSLYPN
jgi:hypothetical protein